MFVNKYGPDRLFMEGEPGSSGGGTDLQKQIDELTQKLNDSIAETDRLRTHSATLLDEKKKLQKQYGELGDPDHIAKLLKQIENDENIKMFAEGKGNEVLAKHTEKLTLEFKNQLDEITKKLDDATNNASKFEKAYHDSESGHAISAAAIKSGIRDTALDDVLLRGRGVFSVGDDGSLEARNAKGELITVNNKPLTPELFVSQLRDKYPHYWPDSSSGGARGGAGGGLGPNPFEKGPNYSMTEQAKIRRIDPAKAKELEAAAKAS